MKMTRKQRQNESVAKTKRREKKKEKAHIERTMVEGKMAAHLKASGWEQSDKAPEVWKISGWSLPGVCCRTLRQAYKIQIKLDSEGHERPVGIDDAIEL